METSRLGRRPRQHTIARQRHPCRQGPCRDGIAVRRSAAARRQRLAIGRARRTRRHIRRCQRHGRGRHGQRIVARDRIGPAIGGGCRVGHRDREAVAAASCRRTTQRTVGAERHTGRQRADGDRIAIRRGSTTCRQRGAISRTNRRIGQRRWGQRQRRRGYAKGIAARRAVRPRTGRAVGCGHTEDETPRLGRRARERPAARQRHTRR